MDSKIRVFKTLRASVSPWPTTLNLAPQLLPYNNFQREREAARVAAAGQRKGPEKRLNLQQFAPPRSLTKAPETNATPRALKPPTVFCGTFSAFYLTR